MTGQLHEFLTSSTITGVPSRFHVRPFHVRVQTCHNSVFYCTISVVALSAFAQAVAHGAHSCITHRLGHCEEFIDVAAGTNLEASNGLIEIEMYRNDQILLRGSEP